MRSARRHSCVGSSAASSACGGSGSVRSQRTTASPNRQGSFLDHLLPTLEVEMPHRAVEVDRRRFDAREEVVVQRPFVDGVSHLQRTGAELRPRSEEHTSELQSRPHLVCRLLLEKKKNKYK